MFPHATDHQRSMMRALFRRHGGDEAAICAAYARAEAAGQAFRKWGDYRLSSEAYAKALLAQGLAQGWIGAVSAEPSTA